MKEIEIINLIESNERMHKTPKERDFILTKKINERKNGKIFTTYEHLQCLIGSLLSNQRPWKPIEKNMDKINEIFCNYNPNLILEKLELEGYKYFVDELKKISCGNRSINYQMQHLKDNINLLLKFERDAGTIDNYYSRYSIKELVNKLSDANSEMKIHGMGNALVWEYLRGVGYDGMKPDLHIMRIFGSNRLGYSKNTNATTKEVYEIADMFSLKTGKSKSYIDILLWEYCAAGKGEICTANPKCNLCTITKYCNYPNLMKEKL